jgi:hypothetical protein
MAEADKIRIEPLTVSNYPTWSARMKMLLVFKDLWEGIKPGTDVKKSELAKALIGLNVSPEYALTVEVSQMLKQHGSTLRTCLGGRAMLEFCSSKGICPTYDRNLGNWWSRMPHGPGMFSQSSRLLKSQSRMMSCETGPIMTHGTTDPWEQV